MASLFDQYQEASTRIPSSSGRNIPEPVTAGFINARMEDDTPIFNKQRINYNPADPITHLCVCSNYLVMAMSSNILLRIDLSHPDKTDEVEIPKSLDDRIYKTFLDDTGRHAVVSMISGENYYIVRGAKKARVLGKLKGHQISAIGWNTLSSTDVGTGPILIGTAKGIILETEIISGEDGRFFQSTLEQYVKPLFTLSKDKVYPITGIQFQKVQSSSATTFRYFILVTNPGRLYQFIGGIPTTAEAPLFHHIFSRYEQGTEQFLELPGNFGYSELKLFHPKFRALPTSFAWMVGPGMYCGSIETSGASGPQSVTVETKLVPYPWEEKERHVTPLALVLTEFHVLVLFPDRLKAISVLNDQLIFDDIFPEKFGRLVSMCRDPVAGTIWAFTSSNVFKYKVVRESRDVWQMFLDKNNFEKAKFYAEDNPANMDKVLTGEADCCFQEGQYEESANIYAQTYKSFEEVALKFIQLEQKDALKIFLRKKMDGLKPQDKTQLTMIVTWLIEVFLNQLGQLKEEGEDMSEKYDSLQDEFRKFLAQPRVKECSNENRTMVYELIASHGDIEDMVFFAVLMKDHERVITHYLQHDKFDNALEVLSKQQNIELFYKFSPILMQNIPHETVDAWIGKREKFEPKKLIPALVQYDPDKNRAQGNEAIRYLEFCVQMLSVKDQAIHNYLLSLYSKLQPDSLIVYLNMQGQDPDQVCYDLEYALRLCSEHKHQKACVHIYSTMGLYEEAVDLALQVDIDLAKLNADKPEEDEELRKKLWLKIARHVVEQEKDIRLAMEFVHDCDLLKIEDILPFFPDFVTIDHFKDAICNSLQEYNQHIDSLKEEMEEATESAREIRADIHAFRNKYSFVKAQEKCSSCNYPLMTRAFYLFPCLHKFHSDCLIAELLPHLSVPRAERVTELQRKLAAKDRSAASSGMSPAQSALGGSAKEELDEIVAAECIYCGDVMIKCIDKPFIDEDEQTDLDSWL